MTRHNNKAEMRVSEIITDVQDQVCQNYCKYTEQYLSNYKDVDEAEQRKIADQCNYCPLTRL